MPAILVNDVSPVISYVATAAQTLFAVPFEFFDVGDIVVERAGVELVYSPTPANNNQYSVVGANVEGGGSITLGSPGATLGETIVIYRDVPIERLANYPETGPMAVRSLNAEQAKHIAMMQQLERDVNRSVTVPIGESSIDLPSAAERAEKILTFDAAGAPSTEFDIGLLTGSVISSGAAPAQNIEFTATAGQTVFNFVNAAVPTFVSVFLNGVKLPSTDFTHSGTTVTLLTPATVGDRVALEGFSQSAVIEALALLSLPTGAGLVGYGDKTVEDALDALIALPHGQRALQKIANNNEDVNIVLLGDSTGDATTEWYYLLATALAADYPTHTFKYATWNDGTSSYNTESTLTTGSGARVVKFWNASVAGTVASYYASDKFFAAVEQIAPDLVFLSYGHNGGTSDIRQISYFSGISQMLNSRIPDVPSVVIGQNPTLSDETMAAKVTVLRGFASRQGYGFIDVHSAFKQAGVALSTLLADSVHPNATGSAIWKDTVYNAMFASRQAYGGAAFTPDTIIANYSTVAEFSRWIASNCTVTKNTTFWETVGHSTQLATTASGVSYIYTSVVTSDDIISLRGKYVTVHARLRVPAGSLSTTGRIDIYDDAGSTSSTGIQQGDNFISFTCTRKVDAAATYLRVYLYPSSETGTATYQVDRVTVSVGLVPIDSIVSPSSAMRRLFMTASQPNGLGVLHNISGSSVGLRYVPSETADPSTAWTSDFRQDGLAVKQTADAHPRVDVREGGIFFGSGSAAATFRINYRLSDGCGINSNWYPNSDATFDLGASGVAWRDLSLTRALRVGANQVVGARKTGWGAPTGTATRTTFDTTTVTLPQLAERVKALLDDLNATAGHGLIGT
jgi:lysophospholipase L1-like esterase